MAITAGGSLNTVPHPIQSTLASNYVEFTVAAGSWVQQYLPDLMEKEAEGFGNRTISGFLSQVGAEESMSADQVVWSEQGRLHLAYTGTVTVATSVVAITAHAGTNATYVAGSHGLRVGDTVLVASAAGVNVTIPCRVTAVSTDNVRDASLFLFKNFFTALSPSCQKESEFSNVNATVIIFGANFSPNISPRSPAVFDS